ncbi:MAG: BamA/TamA family outer membrane protein [Chitinophagales bacterium]|nr:BamA/TamA family outer membrane protein [Chitinophagales bacterium]
MRFLFLNDPIFILLILPVIVGKSLILNAQEDSIDLKHSTTRDFQRISVFPAISYTPETKITLGAIGYYFMDLSKGGKKSDLSNINFLIIYTTAKQVAIESKFELYFDSNNWRSRGEIFYNHYPDRNYGVGNDASVSIAEYRSGPENPPDTINYLSVNTDRIKFSPTLLRLIKPNLYLGLQTDIEYIYNYRPLYKHKYLDGDSTLISEFSANGLRSGIGLQMLFDSRDNILNPLKGYLVEFGSMHYGSVTLSDFSFNSYRIDARAYYNPVLNHTIALQTVFDFREGEGPYALRTLGRIGGRDFLRGYFQGTYQDLTLLGFQIEYRLPFWREEQESKLWQIWKRLGIAVFAGTAQVAEVPSDISLDRFRSSVGGGLRVLFSKESRVNIRIDYAVGLAKNSDGNGKRQKGLYFYLSEAF